MSGEDKRAGSLIKVDTFIHAPIDRCFDLARNIDLHVISTAETGERAIAGRTTGMVELGDTITFSARHLGIRWKLTSEIIEFDKPHKFVDRMLKGPFKRMKHEHLFGERVIEGKEGTLMTDILEMESPFWFIGRIFDNLVLIRHMENFLVKRNYTLKEYAESEKWRDLI